MLSWFFGEIPVLTARSLKREPDRWKRGGCIGGRVYTIERDDGIEVWVGNSSYGAHVANRQELWGGVTALSSFGLSPGHWLVWRAANRWLRRHGTLRAALRSARA